MNPASKPEQKKTVVVVEDDPGVSKAIGRLLRVADLQPVIFSFAEEFLETNMAGCADCLVLDIHLPGISGLELRDRIVSSGYQMPIIFITAHDEPSTRAAAESQRCSAYFSKPFNGRAFLEAVRLAVGHKAMRP
jgi:FixJ family two-component response regulator